MNYITDSMRYDRASQDARDVFKAKNARYDGSFYKELTKWGLTSAAIRLSDKQARFETLIQQPELDQLDESIVDTLIDMANYALMTASVLQEGLYNQPQPVEDEPVETEPVEEEFEDEEEEVIIDLDQIKEQLLIYTKDELKEIASDHEIKVQKKDNKETVVNLLIETLDPEELALIIEEMEEEDEE